MNDRAISKVALTLAASTLVVWAAAADDAVTLAWKFKKGQQLDYVVEQSTLNEGQLGGQTIKSTLSQTLDVQWNIDNVAADGTAQMTQTVSRARLKVTQPGAPPIEYDSSSEEAPQGAAAQIAPMFKVLVGKPVKLKMSPRGTISDVTLPEGLAEEMKKSAGPLGGTVNEEFFTQITAASTIEFADHPVKTGDTWQHKVTMSNPVAGKQTTDSTYTYRGTEKEGGKQVDRIDVRLKTSIAPAGSGSPQIEIKDQKSEGNIDFDRAAGHVVKSHTKLRISMAINVMGRKIDQTATNETTTRLADGAAGKPSDN